MIPLVKDTINKNDIDKLIEWLKTYPHLTKGKLTVEFEKKWSEMLDCKYSLFVNSGSSANLLILYSLIESGQLQAGDKVIVPAVSWSTDLAPVVQLGLDPVLCDCNMKDLSVDIDYMEEIIKTQKPKALMLVSVLGLVPEMEQIVNLCDVNNIILLEDACESLGSSFNNKKIGTFGLMSSFSTYFGHHISTIEGGIVCTDNKNIFNILKSIRSHGWDRDMNKNQKTALRKKHAVDDFESLYKFYYYGFNVRSTDLQAFLGLGQLDKLNLIVENRNKNYSLYRKLIKNDFWTAPKSVDNSFISNFAFPVIHPDRKKIVDALYNNHIAIRPLLCGSLSKQPFWQKKYPPVELKNADMVDSLGFYLPNNHQIEEKEIELICDIINHVIC